MHFPQPPPHTILLPQIETPTYFGWDNHPSHLKQQLFVFLPGYHEHSLLSVAMDKFNKLL